MVRGQGHVLSQAAIYLVARGVPGMIAFLAIPVFSRLLDAADYGRYALVIASVDLLNALLFQWLRLSLVRFLPAHEDPERLQSTLATAAALIVLLLGVTAGALCFVPAAQSWRPLLVTCALVLPFQAAFELCCEYSRAVIRPWQYMGLQVTRSTVAVVAGVLLVHVGAGWWGPPAGTALGMGLGIIYAYRRDWGRVRFTLDRRILIKVCQYGLPLSATVALANVVFSSDRFLIAGMLGAGAAGHYCASVDLISQTLTMLMMVINLAMFPLAVRAWEQQGRGAAQAQMKSNASLLLAVGVPCVVGLSVLAPGVAECFLGKSFRATAVSIIPLVSLGAFLAGLKAYHFDAAFQFAHRTIYQVWIVLFIAVVNVVLNLIAIPRFGIVGAAVASVIAYAVSIVLTAALGRKYLILPFPVRDCARVLLASVVMSLLLMPLRGYHSPLALAGQITAGGALYGMVLIASNFLGLGTRILCRWKALTSAGQARLDSAGDAGRLVGSTVEGVVP